MSYGLREPLQSSGDLHFQVIGIPVRVHPLFWLMTGIFGIIGLSQGEEVFFIAIWIVAVFISILIHELGHALAALGHGWKPWITLYGLGGLCSYHSSRSSARSKILISVAGPAAGFLFVAVVLFIVHMTGHSVSLGSTSSSVLPIWIFFQPYSNEYLNELLSFLIFINVFWGLVNLVPVYPLDGGQITRQIFLTLSPTDGLRRSLWLSVITSASLAVLLFNIGTVASPFIFGYIAYQNYMQLK